MARLFRPGIRKLEMYYSPDGFNVACTKLLPSLHQA